MYRLGEFGVGTLRPVLRELVVVGLGEIGGGGVGKENLRQVEANAEAACVHCCI